MGNLNLLKIIKSWVNFSIFKLNKNFILGVTLDGQSLNNYHI